MEQPELTRLVLVGIALIAATLKRTSLALLFASGYIASELITITSIESASQIILVTCFNILICLGCSFIWVKREIPQNKYKPESKKEYLAAWLTLMSLIASFLSFSKLVVLGGIADYQLANKVMETIEALLLGVSICSVMLLLILPQKPRGLHELVRDIRNGLGGTIAILGHHPHNGGKT